MDIIELPMLATDSGRELLKFLKAHPDFDGKQIDQVQKLGDYVKIEVLLYEELYQGLELNELHYEAARLQARLIEQYVKTQKASLADQLESADEQTIRQLLAQAKNYDLLLNKVKGAA